jgi:3'-5' exoribonuclease
MTHTQSLADRTDRIRAGLVRHVNRIEDEGLRKSAETVIFDQQFFQHPGSLHFHHAYVGGLAAHTLEVMDFALGFLSSFPAADKDIVLTAALWHDYAKIWDYVVITFYKYQWNEIPKKHVILDSYEDYKKVFVTDPDYYYKVHHISGSMAEFTHAAKVAGVTRNTISRIQHAMLSHHGRKDWGSIIEPREVESFILHTADYSSAHFGPAKKAPIHYSDDYQ